MKFSVTSYNILADAYIRAKYYPHVPHDLLKPAFRQEAVLDRVIALDTDVICLQEVELKRFDALTKGLAGDYVGCYAQKGHNRPDGCAIFYRTGWKCLGEDVLLYDDAPKGKRCSGHVAQTLRLRRGDQSVAITNTHLKWDNKGAADHIGLRQASLLISQRVSLQGDCDAWVVCGDLNATPNSFVISALCKAGLSYAGQHGQQNTCVANGRAGKLDYVFYSCRVSGSLRVLEPVDGETVLPSTEEPSDHLAIIGDLTLSTA